MCMYCMMADHIHKWYPMPDEVDPWIWDIPVTNPPNSHPIASWSQQQLDELNDILKLAKDMEDRLGGCPCEDPNKLNFLIQIQENIDKQKNIQTIKNVDFTPTSELRKVYDSYVKNQQGLEDNKNVRK